MMAAGELDPSVAFMQGRLKTAGDPGLVLDVLAGAAQAR
jgi:putative sterol carrier protein